MKTNKGILIRIKKSVWLRHFALSMCFILFFELAIPTVSYALTSGPGQPEFSSFEPASTTDMVNLYDGSFTYNVPLINIPGPNGGYPINLAYHGNPGMDEEASWVGLGWTLNVGSINRQMQGLPDDYSGDEITYHNEMKKNFTMGIGTTYKGPASSELLGYPFSSSSGPTPPNAINAQIYYNNFKGLGYRVSSNLLSSRFSSKSNNFNGFAALNLTLDSHNGIGLSPSISLGNRISLEAKASYNSRSGLTNIGFSISKNFKWIQNSVSKLIEKRAKFHFSKLNFQKGGALLSAVESVNSANSPNKSASINYSFSGPIGNVGTSTNTKQFSFDIKILGTAGKEATPPSPASTAIPYPFLFQSFPMGYHSLGYSRSLWEGDFTTTTLKNQDESRNAFGYLYHGSSNENGVKDFTKNSIEFNKKMPNLGASKQTYDIYTFTGQGTGGFFRPYSNSIDVLSDATKSSKTVNHHATLEIGKTPTSTPPPTPPLYFHIGGGYEYSEGTHTSGNWKNGHDNGVNQVQTGDFEAAQKVMRLHGENSPVLYDEEYLNTAWKGDEAVKNLITDNGDYFNREYLSTSTFATSDESGASSVEVLTNSENRKKRKHRDKRNTSVKYLDKSTAYAFGYSKNLTYYNESNELVNKFAGGVGTNGHHVSEIVVTQTDGAKYIYGLPVYNKSQKEITQSCAGVTFNTNSPYANIDSVQHLNYDEHQYNNEMKSTTSYPEYAYSWLLTGIVGADYIDDDGVEGISQNDKGYWIKFNYKRTHSNYKWRMPYTGAQIIENRYEREEDNIASFTYGTKEMFYIQSIETPTHIAVFVIEDRRDGIDANGEYANTIGSNKVKYLKEIKLYNKPEYLENPTGAIPVTTVHFRYDYQLCKGIPNYNPSVAADANVFPFDSNAYPDSKGGKLTLREVYFTYEKSNKAALSPYKFYYDPVNEFASAQYNPNYDLTKLDRWGNYKYTSTYGVNYEYGRFPYTDQKTNASGEMDNADMHVAKWSLHRVKLPTGGTIQIEYEPHEYGYEEDKRPMHMFDIVGIGNQVNATTQAIDNSSDWYALQYPLAALNQVESATPTTAPDRFYSGNEILAHLENITGDAFKIFFKLDKTYSSSLTLAQCNEIIKKEYVQQLNKIWFKNKTLMSAPSANVLRHNKFEYVEGYASVDRDLLNNANHFGMCKDVGAGSSDPYTIGFISLKNSPLRENKLGLVKANEMTSLALQAMRLKRDDISNSTTVGTTSGTTDLAGFFGFLSGTLGFITEDLPSMLLSYNVTKFYQGHCKYIALNGNSKIKLFDEDHRKFGGGYRVKSIRLNDNWKNDPSTAVSNIEKAEYGQRYVYTMDGKLKGQSSGVCYEPHQGKEESALREYVEYEESTPLFADDELFVEKPIMDFYYPSASIGYRKVTTYSLSRTIGEEQKTLVSSSNNVDQTTTAPATVTEFYTPKDFPITVDETNINTETPFIVPIAIPGIYSFLKAKKAASQGYSISLNDMAGKLKKTSTCRVLASTTDDPQGTLGSVISSTEYLYKTQAPYKDNGANRLDNTVQLATDESHFETGYMGVYYDMFVEKNEDRYEEEGLGLQVNVEINAPIFIPTAYPSYSINEMSVKTIVTHKVIYRNGILDKIVAKSDQSVITTQNLLFDAETGDPLLTVSNDLYNDPVYIYKYPAHWYYANTGPMYTNDYLYLNTSGGSCSISSTGWLSGAFTTSPTSDDDYNNINHIYEGDVLLVKYTSGTRAKGTVVAKSGSAVNLMTDFGMPLSSGVIDEVSMLRSGRKNMLSTSVGSLVAKGFTNTDDLNAVYTTPRSFGFTKIIDASAVVLDDNWQFDCCNSMLTQETYFNPFVTGSRNIWRVKESYGFNTERVYDNNSRNDGFYSDFVGFNWANPSSNDSRWIKAATLTKVSPYGFEAESKDALGIYSSARYGYGNILPVAMASNSLYGEMDFEGFEDYTATSCGSNNRLFNAGLEAFLVNTHAHTGKYSVLLDNADVLNFVIPVKDTNDCADGFLFRYTGQQQSAVNFQKTDCSCFGRSFLLAGEKYVLSAWAKQTGFINKPTSYSAPQIEVTFYNGTTPVGTPTVYPLSTNDKIIEGWQRFNFDFTVPLFGVNKVVIRPYNNGSAGTMVYFDDFRIHPYDANMVTYVYDAKNFKLRAELDANNFATFYQYNEEGDLIHTKKETVRGIRTINEGRKELQKLQ